VPLYILLTLLAVISNVLTIESGKIRIPKIRRLNMNYRFKLLGLVFLLGSGVAMSLLAKADEVNQETVVKLSGPVEVPTGRVLPAGEYVFKLADNPSEHGIVQIFNEHQNQLLATIFTVPTSRAKSTDGTVITLEERPTGSPEALGKWFFAGQTEGVEFLYLR